MLERWQKEWQILLRVFVFFLLLLSLFRVVFLVFYYPEWGESGLKEGLIAFWYGTRLSLKSAGHPVVFMLLFCSLPIVFFEDFKGKEKWRNFVVAFWIGIFTFLGFARYPYYQNFNSGFNGSLFWGLHEDPLVLLWTVNEKYPIWAMVIGMIGAGWLFFLLWKKMFRGYYFSLPTFTNKIQRALYQFGIILFLVVAGITAGNGGSPFEAWAFRLKNSAIATNDVLNEAIVDDLQGLYRAWDENKRLTATARRNIDPAQMRQYLQKLSDSPTTDSIFLKDFTVRYAKGTQMETPKKIFIIIAESYAQWPMQAKYVKYGISPGVSEIVRKPNSVWLQSILTNGPSTISAITASLTGLVETGQVTTYQPETHRQAYETALAPQMKKMGYKSYFWYGGPSGWFGIKKYALSQGFEEFNGAGELGLRASENRWGAADKEFLEKATQEISKIAEPSVHVMLTISNHSPYTIDLAKEGFPKEEVRNLLPKEKQNDEEFLIELGHQWYADREMKRFIDQMEKEEPNSLFIIVGDHGSRAMYLENSPSLYHHNSVPLIFYGKGISKSQFPSQVAGGQIQIIPTLIELIAPKGFVYYSLMPSLTEGRHYGVNSSHWMSTIEIASRSGEKSQVYGKNSNQAAPFVRDQEWEEAIFAYSWWRVVKGERLK